VGAVEVRRAPGTDAALQGAHQMSTYVSARHVRDLSRILSERDMEILQTIAQLRFVSGAQVRRLHISGGTPMGNERVTRRVLQRLVELGVLDRLERRIGSTPGGSDGYVYLLANGGQRLAHDQEMARARRRRSSVPGQLFVRHALMVAELHARLVESERSSSMRCLVRQPEPLCWRRFSGPDGVESILKPDSLLCMSVGARERDFFIDVDRGTEGSRTLERRMRTYELYRAYGSDYHGLEFPRVLWLAATERRVRVITDVVGDLPAATQSIFDVARFDDAIQTIGRLL
jgi:Replication-relaxation